jgi:hypothetical protein
MRPGEKSMSLKRYASTIAGILAVGVLIALAILAYGVARPHLAQAKSDAPVTFVDKTDNESGIRYVIGYADGQFNGGVIFDDTSIEGVRKYVGFNQRSVRDLLTAGQTKFYVLVVFNRPLSRSEFEQFVNTYALQPYSYSIRTVAPDGMRGTIYGGPIDGNLIPDDLLNFTSKDVQERDGSTIKGWIEVSAIVGRQDLVEVIRDPLVYTVDVTETILRNSLTKSNLSAAGIDEQTIQAYLNDQSQIQMSRVPLFWFLEDYGLVSSR